MKISVVIPAYNEERAIAASLTALMAQDHPDFEVILVDNASTDRTASVAASIPGVTVVSESRKGTMWACERGRSAATGELVVRMDADCLPDPRWLARGAAHFSDPSVVAATGPYDYYDASPVFRAATLIFQKIFYRWSNWAAQRARKGAVMIGGNSFMRASALAAAGGFNTDYVFYGDDTDTAKRMAGQGWVVFDPRLVIRSSARRFKAQGVLDLSRKYLVHFMKVIFSKKPLR
ncbi:MAG: glycosyltransferase family 2 protein [Patescibacteria group bacterium]|nr:glycosyltransferase family 2 protein [Patescibacteria group bacterium]